MISLVPLTLIASWISMCNKDVYDQLAWTSKYIHSRFLYLWYSAHLSTYKSTLQLLLCCHLFDYTWSVALTLQSYLQQLGRLIAVIVDVAGQGQSQLRPLHVLNLTPSWGHPIQGYTKWQLHMSGHIHRPKIDLLEGSTSIWGNPAATSVSAILKSPSKVSLPSSCIIAIHKLIKREND